MGTTIALLCLLCCGAVASKVTTEDLMNYLDHEWETGDPTTGSTNASLPLVRSAGALGAFTMIAVSELGDKTFFIAVVLSLSCSPVCVFLGAASALTLMTVLSACLGLVSTVIPYFWVQCLSAVLFVLFGIKMLFEGYSMKSTAGKEEFEDVQKKLESKIPAKEKGVDVELGVQHPKTRWIFVEAFAMTFLAEWGDRSQIATVILAAKDSVLGVIVGASLGHAACTLLAVVGGRMVADKISLRIVTLFGGLLFLAFAICSIASAVEEYMAAAAS